MSITASPASRAGRLKLPPTSSQQPVYV